MSADVPFYHGFVQVNSKPNTIGNNARKFSGWMHKVVRDNLIKAVICGVSS
jgi:hypothetical protein